MFPRKTSWRHYNEGELTEDMANYSTARETGDFLEKQFQAESDMGLMYKCTLSAARLKFGSRLRVAAQERLSKWVLIR